MSTAGRRALVELSEEYEACDRCPVLCGSRTRVVFGSGSSSAPIVVVGGAPSEDDDAEGAPFAGDAGQLLCDLFAKAWPPDDRMAEIRGVQEDSTYFEELRDYLDGFIFWTNAVLCFPPEARDPTKLEVKNCTERLHKAIYAVDPVLVVAVGKASASLLVGKMVQITEKHGTIYDVSIRSPVSGAPVRYPALTIMHPVSLLKQGDQKLVKKRQGPTYETIQDLRNGLQLLEQLHVDAYGRSFLERQ